MAGGSMCTGDDDPPRQVHAVLPGTVRRRPVHARAWANACPHAHPARFDRLRTGRAGRVCHREGAAHLQKHFDALFVQKLRWRKGDVDHM